MRHMWVRVSVMVLGLGGWLPVSAASTIVGPPQPVPWIIESADYTGDVRDQIVRLEVRYTIRVLRDGWTEVPLSLSGATITDAEIEKKAGEAHIAPLGNSYVLAADRKGTYRVRVKLSTLLAQEGPFEGVRLGVPRATFSMLSLVVPRKEVELRQADQLYVENEPDAAHAGVKLTARLGAADQIDLRWRTKPAAPVKVEPVLYGDVRTLVTVEEQLARVAAVIDYRMAQGEIKELMVHLPSAMNVLNVRGSGIEDWRVADAQDHKVLTVTLGFPLKEMTYRLLVEGEEAIEGASAEYALPEIRLAGVKQERGYLAVARTGSIELSARTAEGVSRVDVKELPEELRASGDSPILLAFKYYQHPYRAAVGLTRHQDHSVLTAIAERGELVTVLSQQGELLTRATYLIRANKKQFLEALLPEGAALWSCLVGGKSVKPVEGAEGRLLVPLDVVSDGAEAVSVELVYFERRDTLTRLGHLKLQGPRLDVPTTVANWTVYAPKTVKFLRISGNVERGAVPVEFVEEPFAPVLLAAAEDAGRREIASQGATTRQLADRDVRKELARNKGWAALDAVEGAFKGMAMQKRARKAYASSSSELEFAGADELNAFTPEAPAGAEPAPSREEREVDAIEHMTARLQESGVLPLKIRLPKAGTIYRFNRLMTTVDALTLDAMFVHLRMPWLPFAALGLVLLPVGALVVARF